MARMAKMRSCRLQDPDAGFVSDATNLVEYPQLVADRILRYAAIVGRENVVAGTDCGRGGWIHADLAWAKLRTLVDGARFASTSLWPWLNLLATVADFWFRLSTRLRAMPHTACRRAPGSVRHVDGASLRCRHGSGGRSGTPGKVPVGSCRWPGPRRARLDSVR